MRTVTVNNNQNPGLISQLVNTYVGTILPQMLMDNYAQRGTQKILDKAQASQTMTNMDKANGYYQQMLNASKMRATDPTKASQLSAQAIAGLSGLGYTGLDYDMPEAQIQQGINDLSAQNKTFADYLANNNGTIAGKTWKPTPTWVRNGYQGAK